MANEIKEAAREKFNKSIDDFANLMKKNFDKSHTLMYGDIPPMPEGGTDDERKQLADAASDVMFLGILTASFKTAYQSSEAYLQAYTLDTLINL